MTVRWDMRQAQRHAAARRVMGDAGYSSAWQWVVAHLPRIAWR